MLFAVYFALALAALLQAVLVAGQGDPHLRAWDVCGVQSTQWYMGLDPAYAPIEPFSDVYVNGMQLRAAAGNVGDIDGDGQIDLLFGGTDSVYLVLMNIGGESAREYIHIRPSDGVYGALGGMTQVGGANHKFGNAFCKLGDVDNDGVLDIGVVAFGWENTVQPRNKGALLVLLMNSDGTVREDKVIAPGRGGHAGLGLNTDNFFYDVVNIGDLDADGTDDVFLTYYYDTSSASRGSIWLMHLTSDGTVKDEIYYPGEVFGAHAGAYFGRQVASIGDVDLDGIVDLAVSEQFHANTSLDGNSRNSMIFIVKLYQNGTVDRVLNRLARGIGGVSDRIEDGSFWGETMCELGDINGDGIGDLAATSYRAHSNEGEIYLLFLRTDGSVLREQIISNSEHWGYPGQGAGYTYNSGLYLGKGLGLGGDVNNDGVPELISTLNWERAVVIPITYCDCFAPSWGDWCEKLPNDCTGTAFYGTNCDLPCLHGSLNTEYGEGCNCAGILYTGDDCSIEVDSPCTVNSCSVTNGQCVVVDDAYECDCGDSGYTGTYCDEDLCDTYACIEGTCLNYYNASNVTCLCDADYTGVDCSEMVDNCVDHMCTNNSTCLDGVAEYTCDCLDGYNGTYCELDIDDCGPETNPCFINGTVSCSDLGANLVQCECKTEFYGDYCETEYFCTHDAALCQNGGDCVEDSCECLNGTSGMYCEVNADDCTEDSCMNGGTCVDGIASFHCTCLSGFTGALCETDESDESDESDVNYCLPDPCVEMNNATCVNGNDSYTCLCSPGFTGEICESDIDDCASSPCNTTGASGCFDLGPELYECKCNVGYAGFWCEETVCACINGGVCNDEDESDTCVCTDGFFGEYCDLVASNSATVSFDIDVGATDVTILAIIEDAISTNFPGIDLLNDEFNLEYSVDLVENEDGEFYQVVVLSVVYTAEFGTEANLDDEAFEADFASVVAASVVEYNGKVVYEDIPEGGARASAHLNSVVPVMALASVVYHGL